MSEKRFRNEEDLALRSPSSSPAARRREDGEGDGGDVTAASRSLRALDRERATAVPEPRLSPLDWLDRIEPRGTVQAKAAPGATEGDEAHVHGAAQRGVAGSGQPLPHADKIQAAFGRHDIAHVKAHVGGDAATASRAIGAEAYAVGDQVAFAQQPDLHLAAHEAAHVVQQRAGVSLKGGVGQAGDPYEQHADAVADLVASGKSAESLLDSHQGSGSHTSTVQRFGSAEHQEEGNLGSGGEHYTKGGLTLDHGDLTMLRADYFEEQTLLDLWKTPSPLPGKLPGTQDEVICAIKDARSGDPRFASGGVWAEYTFSDKVKSAVSERYMLLASKNADHFVDPKRPGFGRGGYAPGSAPATYREAHERAIAAAYDAGVAGRPNTDAMVTEAMGQHFLTDSFAAGHITTPRGAISDQWNRLYPQFPEQFKAKLIDDISQRLADDASLLASAIPISQLRSGVRGMLEKKLATKPAPTLGHIFSLVSHDYDNVNGVDVVNDLGWRWRAYGDGHLNDPSQDQDASTRSQKDVIVAAVEAGTNEIRRAYDLGRVQQKTPLDHFQVFDQIRQQAPSPAQASDRYAPEQYLPRPDPASMQGDLHWQAKSLEEMWTMHIRGAASPTYGKLVVESAVSGEVHSILSGIRDDLPKKIDPFSEIGGVGGFFVTHLPVVALGHGHIFPREAFNQAVIAPLQDVQTALQFLLDIIRR